VLVPLAAPAAFDGVEDDDGDPEPVVRDDQEVGPNG
jgi:hypothetical protein